MLSTCSAAARRRPSAPPGATVDPATGLLQWTAGEEGKQRFAVKVTDSTALSDTTSFNVDVIDAALLAAGVNVSATEGAATSTVTVTVQ